MTKGRLPAYSIAIGGIVTLAVIMGIGRFVYTPILPFMISSGVINESQAGVIATANYAGYLVGAFSAAGVKLPGGIRFWFIVALIFSTLSTLAMGFTHNPILFGLIRFISGLASAYAFVFCATLIVQRLAKLEAMHLSGVHFMGVGIGISGSALLISGLANLGQNWQNFWITSGFASMLGMLVAIVLIPSESVSIATKKESEPRLEFKGPLIRLIIAYGLFGFGYVITATFISTIARQELSLQDIEPYVWLFVGLSAIPSAKIMTVLSNKFGSQSVLACIACLLLATGVAISVLIKSPVIFPLSAILLGGTFVGITAVGLMEASRLATDSMRQAFGYMTASFGLGQMIGPFIAGEFFTLTGSFFPRISARECLANSCRDFNSMAKSGLTDSCCTYY